jgi:hypothetical protein
LHAGKNCGALIIILLHWGATTTNLGNPPRSKMKGRKKEKRLKRGMKAEAKRKNKCGICKLTGHNAARCLDKIGREDG